MDAALASSDVRSALANVDITLSMPGTEAAAAAAPPAVVKKVMPDSPKQASPAASRQVPSSFDFEDPSIDPRVSRNLMQLPVVFKQGGVL